jgi:hypothetical protein
MNTENLAIVEWHDGVLARVQELEHGVRLHFSRVFIYRELSRDEYDIEACEASLDLQAGSLSACTNSSEVADCELEGPCKEDDVQSLLIGIGAGKIRLTMADGTELKTGFRTAKLELREPFVHVEHWSGPLVTQEPQ